MSEPFARLRRFLRELKRRNVYRVAVTYGVVAFVTLQAAQLVFPATTLEGLYDKLVVLAFVGFPIALVLAWAFEMTPEGVRRTEAVEGEDAAGSAADQWIGLAVVVLLAGGLWYVGTGAGGEPSTETAASADTTRTTRTPTDRSASRDRPFVAVLPLENLSPDEENAFFADGIHEEILGQLSKVSGLGVFARTTMVEIANAGMTAAEIGRELDAQAVLEGSVRRAGDRVRISAQLIDPDSRDHLWSETYERTLSTDAVFDIQADIAGQITEALETELVGDERRRIEDAPTEDLAAYEAFLRGRGQVWQSWGRLTTELVDRATRNLRDAVEADSSFADAHAWLAQAHLARVATLPSEEAPRWLDSAQAAVERARRIDPDRAAIHVAQAGIYKRQDSLQAEAEALHRALELQPSHGVAKAELSRNLAERGELAEAVRVGREAVRLDPRRPRVLRGMGDRLQATGLHDAAEAWYRNTLEIEPGYFPAYAWQAFNELDRGRPERALALWQDYFDQADSPPGVTTLFATWAALAADRPEQARDYRRQAGAEGYLLGHAELRLGNEKRGRRLLQESVEEQTESVIELSERLGRPVGVFRAGALAALGRTEEALREVERVAEEGSVLGRQFLSWFPTLDPLRSNPRFQEIVREIEALREEAREEVRRMDLDLYPPGAEPDSVMHETQADD